MTVNATVTATVSALASLLALASPALAAPGTLGIGPLDAEKVVTAEACRECHVTAYDVWDQTKHATGFKTLHRQENAAEIAERMGFRLIKRDSLCLDCHYTPIVKSGGRRADSGVSCESCHGAGRDYIDVHNDYGGKGITHDTESADHRQQRIAASRAAGMRRASDLYALAASCYSCHSVPNEKLINVGRHSLGGTDFDLAEWTQGASRHNFLDSLIHGDGTVNAVRSIEHRRRLLVLGKILAVEYALRGVAVASEDGVFLKAGQKRLRRATSDLQQVALATGSEEAMQMLAEVRGVKARLGQSAELVAAADRIVDLGRGFLEQHDGTRLAAIDPLLEGKELPFVDDPDAIDPNQDDEVALASNTEPDASGSPGASPSATGGTVQTAARSTSNPASSAVPAVGEKRSHIRPTSSHETLEVTACQKCHGDQNAWWFKDRHYASIEPFLDRGAQQIKIARLYGISPSRMSNGKTLCMDCHSTVATSDASRDAVDGVSCQSCHGPAADYLDIHQAEEGEALGSQRPGYLKALKVGMKDLRNLETAVRNCASCHYVTDPRLISSGHPSGLDFDIVAAMPKIRHWRADVEPAARLNQAWASVLAERGAVPQVRLARLADSSSASASSASVRSSGSTSLTASSTGRSSAGSIPGDRPDRVEFRTRPADSRGRAQTGRATSGSLPDLPAIEDGTPIEDVLRILQHQLERLYAELGGPSRAAAPQNNPGGGS